MLRRHTLVSVVATSLLSVSALPGCGGASSVMDDDTRDTVVLIGIVLLQSSAPLDVEALGDAMERFTAGAGPAVGPTLEGEESGEMIVQLGDERVWFLQVPAPVPGGEADQYAENSFSYLYSGWQLPAHREHLVVAVSSLSSTPRVEAVSEFVDVLASVVATTDAVGVYVPDMFATHDPALVTSVAEDAEPAAALPLLTGVSVAYPTPETISFLSLGMTSLGIPDLMLDSPVAVADASLEMFADLLVYVCMRGAPIPEGETVGRDDLERLPVRYQPSPITPGETIWTVVVP